MWSGRASKGERMAAKKPVLVLLEGRKITAENLVIVHEKLTGRTAAREQFEEVKKILRELKPGR